MPLCSTRLSAKGSLSRDNLPAEILQVQSLSGQLKTHSLRAGSSLGNASKSRVLFTQVHGQRSEQIVALHAIPQD